MYNYDAQLMQFRVEKKRAWPGSVILRLTHVAVKGLQHIVFQSLRIRIGLSELKLKLKAKYLLCAHRASVPCERVPMRYSPGTHLSLGATHDDEPTAGLDCWLC